MYISATLSLAVLELLVHLVDDEAPADLVATVAEIPIGVRIGRITRAELPDRWRGYPAPGALADIGERWVREARTAVLAVSSAVIPAELNYLLNPRHPAFGRIRVRRPEPFDLDPRVRRR